ncbi:dihydropteroate synthase [Olivibacter sitiensis]|uniref:dihydropteroate synthase n=1 Tax=Olivibacter sitiensis TaxID=376470 RepID=UPI000416006E|nr:dihydropteroate synthase [Olivibacter sitiensis]
MLEEQTLIRTGKNLMDLSRPRVMGILNLTPDSFYDGGQYLDTGHALEHAEQLLAAGADILDLGGYSSRPGAADVSEGEEIDRLLPMVELLVKKYPQAVLSIDTFRASVAEACLRAGAHMINDIGGGNLDDNLFDTVAKYRVPYVLMHSRGTPNTMQRLTQYDDLVIDMIRELLPKIARLRELGLRDIIVDPGFGFAKTLDQNYELLARMDELKVLGLPILGALSRKSMVYKLLNNTAAEALTGTTVLHTLLLEKGVNIIRVHDVKEAVEAIKVWEKYKSKAQRLETKAS